MSGSFHGGWEQAEDEEMGELFSAQEIPNAQWQVTSLLEDMHRKDWFPGAGPLKKR